MSAEQTPDIADLAAVLADLNAEGWTTESDHDPGCPGDERYCMSHCPVPVQVRRGPDDLAAALAPVLDAAVRDAEQRALREAASKVANYRNGATGRRAANADLFGQVLWAMADDLEYQQERLDRADRITEPVSHEGGAQ